MKVVEKLFIEYLRTPIYPATQNYVSAKRVLSITEDNASIKMKDLERRKNLLSEEFPLSIYRAEDFLNSNKTKMEFFKDGKRYNINKNEGWDFKLKEQLGEFVEYLNNVVMTSMELYNTDRKLSFSDTDSDEIDEYL